MIGFKKFLELNQQTSFNPADQIKADSAKKAVIKNVGVAMPLIQSIKPNTSSNDPNKAKAAAFLTKQTFSQESPTQNLDPKKVSSVAKGIVSGLAENFDKKYLSRFKPKCIKPAKYVSPMSLPFKKNK